MGGILFYFGFVLGKKRKRKESGRALDRRIAWGGGGRSVHKMMEWST